MFLCNLLFFEILKLFFGYLFFKIFNFSSNLLFSIFYFFFKLKNVSNVILFLQYLQGLFELFNSWL